MAIVSKPATKAYRDNYPFPDRRAAVVDKPGEPVVGKIEIASVPAAAGDVRITLQLDLLEKVFVRANSPEQARRAYIEGFGRAELDAVQKACLICGGNVYAVELRIKKVD